MKNNKDLVGPYSHQEIEKKWQNYWQLKKIFYTDLENFNKPKKYILPMFPYPSGEGLHVGHVRNYTITDAMARFYRMMGFNVLLATGWDAFGLPSEQYAIQTNNHPSIFTCQNIKRFKNQLLKLGFSYDWTKEINTSEPNYYHWTQWIFKKIYLEKLADYKEVPVFWCKQLATVLSNEEIKTSVDGNKISERGSFPVTKIKISQWVLKITDYAHKLSSGLDNLDWPSNIKNLQKNWIGISEGSKIKFNVVGKENEFIEVFTTRADTIYGVNAIALSPSIELVSNFVKSDLQEKIFEFCRKWENREYKIEGGDNDLLGEFTGSYCINPFNQELIPIWVTNFAFIDYGVGALMISPFSKDIIKNCSNNEFLSKKEIKQNFQIDYKFSEKFNLKFKTIVKFKNKNFKDIIYVNSPLINGQSDKKASIEKINTFLKLNNLGGKSFSYHLKDWIFSRQRYWGEPIPIVHSEDKKMMKIISDEEIPLELPSLLDFTPSSNYYSPLQKATDWVNVTDAAGGKWVRDVNVMPQWAGSCWYYIAFLLRSNQQSEKGRELTYIPLNSEKAKKIIDFWLPVDLYVGGQEHCNSHLLYARFWHKVLNKIGIAKSEEPFQKLICQGMIMGKDGEKMSKSKGNVINPDECLEKWGSDALRLYEIFLCPVDKNANFEIDGVSSMKKWLNRVYFLFSFHKDKFVEIEKTSDILDIDFEKMIRKVNHSYQNLRLNLIVAKLMEFVNRCYLVPRIPISYAKAFLQLLNPLAPHITEEIWSWMENESIAFSNWPSLPLEKQPTNEKKKNLVIQINGKKKKIISVKSLMFQKSLILEMIKNDKKISFFLKSRKIKRVLFVKNELINIVTEEKE